MAEKVKNQKVVFGINIDKDLKMKLKRYCVEQDKTLTEAIEEALEEYCRKGELNKVINKVFELSKKTLF